MEEVKEIEVYRNGLILLGITKLVELLNVPNRMNIMENRYKWLINLGCAMTLFQITFINNAFIKFYIRKKV
jgi:hypothetical protein